MGMLESLEGGIGTEDSDGAAESAEEKIEEPVKKKRGRPKKEK